MQNRHCATSYCIDSHNCLTYDSTSPFPNFLNYKGEYAFCQYNFYIFVCFLQLFAPQTEIYTKKYLTNCQSRHIMIKNSLKPVRKKSSHLGQFSASRGRCKRGSRTFGEWTFEGGRKFNKQVAANGSRARYPAGLYKFVQAKPNRNQSLRFLGGTAVLSCPINLWGSFFIFREVFYLILLKERWRR